MDFYVGIDIGGTQTRIALVDGSGNIQKEMRFATIANDVEQHVEIMAANLQTLTKGYNYASVGIASPGPLNAKTGIIGTPPNLSGWHGFPLVDVFSAMIQKPVVLENDANLAAFAEASVGAGAGEAIVQFFTISTGIGGGLVINGNLYTGANGMGLEVANCMCDEQNTIGGNTKHGSVERICSGTGILAQAQELGLAVASTKDVFELAYSEVKDIEQQKATQLITYVGEQFGNFLASIQGIIDPSVIVLGGSVALYNPMFVELVYTQMKERVYERVQESCHIRIAKLGDAAGVIGAALWSKAKL